MISVNIQRNEKGRICGYTVTDHGETDICAAVSLLTLNTANSIETFTDEDITYDYDPKGGFLKLELPLVIEGQDNPQVDLLLEAMVLGLKSVKENYSDEIELKDEVSI